MNSVVRAEFESVDSGLREAHVRGRRIRTGNVYRGWSRVEFPQDGGGPAGRDDRSAQYSVGCSNGLIRSGVDCWRAR